MTISELAQRTGVSKHTLRYYERAGLVPSVGRNPSSGHRRYGPGHSDWITFVRNLRATGMPIRELKAYAALVAKGDHTWPRRKEMLAAHRARIVAMMDLLAEQRKMIDRKLALGCAPRSLGKVAGYALLFAVTAIAKAQAQAADSLPDPAPLRRSALTWTQAEREFGFPHYDRVFGGRVVDRGPTSKPLPAGPPLSGFAAGTAAGQELERFIVEQKVAGLIVLNDGKVRL